jgi:hypothetical protein
VELDHVISPEIGLAPSIGHTPGHVSVMIESEGERALITGDMTHHPYQLAHPDWSLGDDDPKAAGPPLSRLFAEWADQTILVIGTHSPPPPPATSSATAQRSGLRCEGGRPLRRCGRHHSGSRPKPDQHNRAFVASDRLSSALSLRWPVARRSGSSSKPCLLQTALDAHSIQSRPSRGLLLQASRDRLPPQCSRR